MRLLSLRKGKERLREALGERSGVRDGDVRLWSAMSEVTGEDEGGWCVDAASHSAVGAAGVCPLADVRVLLPGEAQTLSRSGLSLQVGQEDRLRGGRGKGEEG